jgi:hypothetical protein
MTNLITEARELCEKAMALEIPTERLDYSTEYVPLVDAIHIIPELCDALEKAQVEIEQLNHICQPICRSCGLRNARFFINNSCDRCGGDLRLPIQPEKEGE